MRCTSEQGCTSDETSLVLYIVHARSWPASCCMIVCCQVNVKRLCSLQNNSMEMAIDCFSSDNLLHRVEEMRSDQQMPDTVEAH